MPAVNRRPTKRLALQRETLRRLASGELARVAGGWIARCSYERSGCYGMPDTDNCCPEGTDNTNGDRD